MTRYKVIGVQEVGGHPPGDTFDDSDLPEDQVAFWKQIGAIRAVGGPAPADPHHDVESTAEEIAEEQEQEKRTES